MKPAVVIDTNVLNTANGLATQAGAACVRASIDALLRARASEIVLVDDAQRILSEYRIQNSMTGQPGPGDGFLKWLWNNQANAEHCLQVEIRPSLGRSENYVEFPSDARLAAFDADDRKFVAVAIASRLNPFIVNATDTDWWESRVPLLENGVRIRFLCPDLMAPDAATRG